MMLFAGIVFFVALLGIVGLFASKQWELSRDRVLIPDVRTLADREALHIKELLVAGRKDLEKLPPLLLYATQEIVHRTAIEAGYFAHYLGMQAHRLADAVSHKHNFTRRETRSEFLKKVAEHKNASSE